MRNNIKCANNMRYVLYDGLDALLLHSLLHSLLLDSLLQSRLCHRGLLDGGLLGVACLVGAGGALLLVVVGTKLVHNSRHVDKGLYII
jgi:hypothetical protein